MKFRRSPDPNTATDVRQPHHDTEPPGDAETLRVESGWWVTIAEISEPYSMSIDPEHDFVRRSLEAKGVGPPAASPYRE